METPFFSIIIPVYNVENYLERCVQSILKQSFKDYEIILVDDGSTDSSSVLCDNLANLYYQIKSYHKKNCGLASARNFGIKYAKGKYISFIDSDDWIEHDMYNYLRDILNKYSVDIIKFGYYKRQNNEIINSLSPLFEVGYYNRKEILDQIIRNTIGPKNLFSYNEDPILSAWAHVYKRDFIINNNLSFISERIVLNEDYLFNLNAILYAKDIFITDKKLYNYDMRLNSLTLCYKTNMIERKKELFNNYLNLLEQSNVISKYKDSLTNFYIDSIYACLTNECGIYSSQKKNDAIKNVKIILNDNNLIKSLRQVKCKTIKTRIIIFLMRLNLASVFYYSYKITIKLKGIFK